MNKRLIAGIALGLLAGAQACAGQDARPPVAPQQDGMPQAHTPAKPQLPTGTLTGTVYCADTNLPARLAAIYLVQTSDHSSGIRSSAISDLEGRFALSHVREGDYYVVAVLPGYLSWMSSLSKSHLDALTADERKKLLALVPSVTISANQPAELSLRLERGAEIDGTVTYDDGSPAIGARMSFRLKVGHESNGALPQMMEDQNIIYSGMGPPMTDDRGRFRILGVPPGEYVVSVSVPAESAARANENQAVEMIEASIGAVDVYVGGGLRASKAEVIKVTAGGAAKDADITIPLSKLHTIHGQVVLKSTGQPPPAAVVQLVYADTEEPARMTVAPNGEFEIRYVPEGSFILRAIASPEPLPQINVEDSEDEGFGNGASAVGFGFMVSPNENAGKMEGGAEVSLLVTGDVDNVNIAVPDPPASHAGAPGSVEGQNATPAGPVDAPQ